MDVASFDRAVNDHTAAVLLRYFSSISSVQVDRPILAIERDRELLRLHWSLSAPVTKLANYVLEHRHEIQSVLSSEIRVDDGILRGRLDASATLRLRRVSGLPTALVSHEPLRSYNSGPNQLLGWVLMEAWSLAARFSTITLDSAAYKATANKALQRLDQCRRLQSIAQITGQSSHARRPSAASLVEAGRSRRILYRMAREAFLKLLEIEAGNPITVAELLRETLLGPLEPWRRFELAVGFSIAESLAEAEGSPLRLNILIGDVRREIARAGRFSVFWQWRTDYYVPPAAEPSEAIENEILDAYGISWASDRPDLVVVDNANDEVAAVIEVKYLTGEDATDRVKSAVEQLVRYARGYVAMDDVRSLLERCLAVVSQGLDGFSGPGDTVVGIPLLADFEGIKQKALQGWAHRLSDGAALPS